MAIRGRRLPGIDLPRTLVVDGMDEPTRQLRDALDQNFRELLGRGHEGIVALDGHDHDGVYEPADADIQAHITSPHAPANAQKNSDITKPEIEAVLTGEITSHTHPAGGGGSDWDVVIVKSVDEPRASDTILADDSELVLAGGATAQLWAIELRIAYHSLSATPDFKFRLSTDGAGMYGFWRYIGSRTTGGGLLLSTGARVTAAETLTVAMGTAAVSTSTPDSVHIEGQFRLLAGAQLAFQWAQNTSVAEPVSVLAGSELRARLIYEP